jgi:hypothetical protein
VFQLAVIGLDRIVRVLLDVMPRRGQQLGEHAGIDGRGVGDHPFGLPLTCNTQSEWVPLGFSPELHTRQLLATHVSAGTGLRY